MMFIIRKNLEVLKGIGNWRQDRRKMVYRHFVFAFSLKRHGLKKTKEKGGREYEERRGMEVGTKKSRQVKLKYLLFL
jgi:hypothetical protein